MLRKCVPARAIAPNERTRAKGLYKPLTAVSILATAVVLSPVQASAVECKNDADAAGGTNAGEDNGQATNTACGFNADAGKAKTNATGASAYGVNADAFHTNSTAIGNNAQVDGSTPVTGSEGGIAVGFGALVGFDPVSKVTVNAPRGIAVGSEGPDTEARGGAVALGADSIAIGTDSVARSDNAIAIGAGADSSSIAVGFGAKAKSQGVTVTGPFGKSKIGTAAAVGDLSQAIGDDTSAFGAFATVNGADPSGNGSAGGTALGAKANVGFNSATGKFADAPRAIAIGTDGADADNVGATALAADAIAIGTDALASGDSSIAIGRDAVASASVAIGKQAKANSGGTAVGDFSSARSNILGTGQGSTALGRRATADNDFATAVGQDATANGFNATAVGDSATANFTNSAAFGADAKATRNNQQVFGTATNTYTMPGITSADSRAAQSGPLSLVTTDRDGNLASDDGLFFRRLDEDREGIAVALATEDPDLVGNERFALKFNWGNFEGENALAVTAALAFGRSVFVPGDRLTISGGAGWGLEHDTVGGRVGLQFSWGGAPEYTTPGFPPLK